jgi:pentatricopeptide repeat protein
MCADVGLVAEAEQFFEEMKLDKWSYTAIINIYGSIKDANRALQLFEKMLQSGIEANIMSYTIVIQCLGKANRIQDAVLCNRIWVIDVHSHVHTRHCLPLPSLPAVDGAAFPD